MNDFEKALEQGKKVREEENKKKAADVRAKEEQAKALQAKWTEWLNLHVEPSVKDANEALAASGGQATTVEGFATIKIRMRHGTKSREIVISMEGDGKLRAEFSTAARRIPIGAIDEYVDNGKVIRSAMLEAVKELA